ncbi:membrane protein [Streptomyces noursei PD-1]|nr:membrane protein [Streptomyces noursei PD-1]
MASEVTAVHIPHQRGRRGDAPFVVVVPQRPTLTARAAAAVGWWVWEHRLALAPTLLGLVALPLSAVLHLLAWWSGVLLTPLAGVPLAWLITLQRDDPALDRAAFGWRLALTLAAITAVAWLALAAAFGPLAGPLGWLWVFLLIAAQSIWSLVRRSH